MDIYARWKAHKAEKAKLESKHQRELLALHHSFFNCLLYKGKTAIVAGVVYDSSVGRTGEDQIFVRENYNSFAKTLRFNDLEWEGE